MRDADAKRVSQYVRKAQAERGHAMTKLHTCAQCHQPRITNDYNHRSDGSRYPNCVHCGKKEVECGNGWRSLTCRACSKIHEEDFDWNQQRINAYNRKEITIEELRAGYRNRIKEMYYSNVPEGA